MAPLPTPPRPRAPSRPPTLPRRWRRRRHAEPSVAAARPRPAATCQRGRAAAPGVRWARCRGSPSTRAPPARPRVAREHAAAADRADGRCSHRRSRCGLVRRSLYSPRVPSPRVAPTCDRSASATWPVQPCRLCSRPSPLACLWQAPRTADKAGRRSVGLRGAARPRSLAGPRAAVAHPRVQQPRRAAPPAARSDRPVLRGGLAGRRTVGVHDGDARPARGRAGPRPTGYGVPRGP
jgi:hypothetical protein